MLAPSKQDAGAATHGRLTLRKAAKLVNCGLVSGSLQAVLFNPWDRALYLSVKNETPFLSWSNFSRPMAGVVQTVVHRTISAGLYFPLEEIFTSILSQHTFSPQQRPLATFIAGTLAGSTNGFLLNPFSRIKYQSWGKPDNTPIQISAVAKDILRAGGARQLFVGSIATIYRDLVFGGCFAFMRHELWPMVKVWVQNRHHESLESGHPSEECRSATGRAKFFINLFSGMVATLLSSPFNYVRNMHYATPPNCLPQSTGKVLADLARATLREETLGRRWTYVRSRLRLGWGTARVGCGMAFGAIVYDLCAKSQQT